MPRRHDSPPVDPAAPFERRGNNGGRSRPAIDWPGFLRRVERKRRMLNLKGAAALWPPQAHYFELATYTSFLLDGLEVTPLEVSDALTRGAARTMLRSRQAQRIRNHAAILHQIESDLRDGHALTSDGVVRWYTAISAGLSTTGLDRDAMARLENMVRRINSPQMRIRAALTEIATTHAHLLADPLVPAFNGILARLLLRYHLGRCNLPAVIFDPAVDQREWTIEGLRARLVELLEVSYQSIARA